jgi:Tol biopolymer transport system component
MIAGLALAALALCALGAAQAAGLFADPPPPPEKPAPPRAAAPAPAVGKPAPAGPNRILFVRDGKLVTLDPDGKNEKVVARGEGLMRPTEARLSPDGKRVAALVKVELPNDPRPGDPPRHRLYVRALDEKEPGTDLGVDVMTFAWSADGVEIAYTGFGKAKPGEEGLPVVHGVVTVATKEVAPLKLPAEHLLLDWSRDGKFFVTARAEEKLPPAMYLLNRDGTEHKALTDAKYVVSGGRLSPDGKKLLYTRVIPERQKGKEVQDSVDTIELRVLDIASGKSARVIGIPRGDWPTGLGLPAGLCWSPDGKRVAYAWRHITTVGQDAADVENEVQLRVCDADGKNAATLATWKVKGAIPDGWLNAIDWR